MSKNVRASLFYRKERDTWIVQYSTITNEGKRKLSKKSFKEKEDAEKFYEELMYKKGNSDYIVKNGVSLRTIMLSNLEKKMESETISKGQYMRINKTIKQFPDELLNKNVDDITETELQEYFNSLIKIYSNSTIKKFYEQFSQAFNNAYIKDYIRINPMKNIVRPKSKKLDKQVRPLTLEEQQKFTEYLVNVDISKVPYKNAFLFQMYLGMRIGEVLALRTYDIDLIHNLVMVRHTMSVDEKEKIIIKDTPKSFNGQRDIPIPDFLKNCIIEQMQIAKKDNHIENLLFVNGNGNYVDHRGANKVLKKILKENFDIDDISTHSLRHTFGTRCIEGGMRDVALQRIMGHGSISATIDNYVDVSESCKEEELKKLYDYFNRENIIDTKS